MKSITALFLIFNLNVAVSAQNFGTKINNELPIVSLNDAIKKIKTLKDKDIIMTGKIEKVCRKKGCWMTLQNEGQMVRVTFKDYGFFVPTDLQQVPVKIQGKLEEREETVKLARHYLEDQGESKEKVMKINKPVMTYHFIATGVELAKK